MSMHTRWSVVVGMVVGINVLVGGAALAQAPVEYRVLAASKTSTLEKEMNEAAAAGFAYGAVMGGETAFGGSEGVVVMQKAPDGGRAGAIDRRPGPGAFEYRLLATNRTSTMQKEIQSAAAERFEYVGQTVFESLFGGREVVVIMQRARTDEGATRHEYLLVSTSKTSTLQKELAAAGERGFEVMGMTVGRTAMGGAELVAILRRDAAP
jgi:hypothetical protein